MYSPRMMLTFYSMSTINFKDKLFTPHMKTSVDEHKLHIIIHIIISACNQIKYVAIHC